MQGLDNYKLGTATAVLPPLSRTLSRYVITYVRISNPFSYLGYVLSKKKKTSAAVSGTILLVN